MAGELPTDQIVRIIDIAKSFVGHDAHRLDELSAFGRDVTGLLPRTIPAHGQGEAIARELRHRLGFAPSDRIDIFDLVVSIGIEIRSDAVELPSFDGLAIAGRHHGPGAFINKASRRLGRGPGDIVTNSDARVTLAHEFCHLLVDGNHPLSAVEVLRSRMPAGVEARARARAFAGEFILPTSAAFDAWQLAGSPVDAASLRAVLQDLLTALASRSAWRRGRLNMARVWITAISKQRSTRSRHTGNQPKTLDVRSDELLLSVKGRHLQVGAAIHSKSIGLTETTSGGFKKYLTSAGASCSGRKSAIAARHHRQRLPV